MIVLNLTTVFSMIATWLVTDYASLPDLGNVARVPQHAGLC